MGYVCTFFGHRTIPSGLQPALYGAVCELILHRNVDTFIVGNEGQFDTLVQQTLSQLCSEHPALRCNIILSTLPVLKNSTSLPLPTIFPEELEGVPRRYSIHRRNTWMLRRCDFVITYIRHPSNGAAQFARLAHQQHKHIIPL